ncbi:alpha-galactosidase [Labilibaculum filiforme]|uniref:Alpha-galactosidase n=1 Tax=Labilibaculum filiforme TaxID=1940526 RepID=A0A2N3HTF2_9BACT|nr:right-handed parallel beta-helix repeat-containing protein [Labilibaculum filiforme]PKQ61326.1 alpha-galactosidase [Labilibaculum filiforme]
MSNCKMFRRSRFLAFVLFVICFTSIGANAKEVIELKATDQDMTPILREVLENISDLEVKIVFEKGTYRFNPDYATEKYCFITNHNNGLKRIIFPMEGFKSIEIEGNGSEFIFHGQILPFQFKACKNVSVKNLSIDWDMPFTFQGEVMECNSDEEWRDIKPFTDGFSWKLRNGRLEFPNIDGFNYSEMGSTLAFDVKEQRIVHGAFDVSSAPRWIEKREGGILRFHEKLNHYPPVGSILHSKGAKEENRYAPAFHVISSNNTLIENVVVHSALGMGFLFERSENAILKKCGIYLPEGSNRVVTTIADATHFCNCKGDILVEDCRFENMLDDGTNVHGTYVEVDKVIDNKIVRVALKHGQQMGFEFAGKDDVIWFIHKPSVQKASENTVASVSIVNDQYINLTFKNALPENLSPGDLLENKTWNPTFTMRGCTIRDHRARNVVLKTPLKTVIENNNFSSMMSSILFRGESYYWFESGAVEDVVIRNNHFEYCAYSGSEHAVMYITPRLGEGFNQQECYDRNIRFENNTITNFDNRIVWADRVDGLVIKGNKITKTNDAKALFPDAPLFDFANCRNVQVIDNDYDGNQKKAIAADEATKKSLIVEKNKGF